MNRTAEWLFANAIALAALGIGLYNTQVARTDQFGERLSLRIDAYGRKGDGNSGLSCTGADSFVYKPYRVILVNTGHVSVTLREISVRLHGSVAPPDAESSVHAVLSIQGQPEHLPMTVSPAEVREFLVMVHYPIAQEAANLVCADESGGAKSVQVLAVHGIDLQGHRVHPLDTHKAAATTLFAPDLSDFPAFEVTMLTETGATMTASYTDKATF